jgi:antitoxin (DNA-binding transcriptional repressor) of toxin-antitoxin stability system
MSTQVTATHLRKELFKTLDSVVATGEPVEIRRPGGTARIVAAASGSRLARLQPHPGTVVGDAETLPDLSWTEDWQPTL